MPIDPSLTARLASLRAEEEAALVARTPGSQALLARARASQPSGVPMAWMAGLYRHGPIFARWGRGAYFEDIDGHRYLDMNQADLAGALGFAPEPVVRALRERTEAGTAFLLPTEDGVAASERLAERTGLPFWQVTGSASSANAEVIRLARLATGRHRILMFEGKYHGHGDDTLVTSGQAGPEPELLGLPPRILEGAAVVPFNDLEALAAALASGDVACVLAEPLLTNCGLVFPDPGFWDSAQGLIAGAGALLILDEAHSFSFAYGGLTRAWNLRPDVLTLGKGLGTGVPFGCYGVREPLARLMERYLDVDIGPPGLAAGGTTYANALALAAARAALEECLTESAYENVAELGQVLAEGLEGLFARHGFEWRAPRIGGRSGWVLTPDLPRNAAEAALSLDPALVDARRAFMANRGIWEAIATAGPACSFAHEPADVELYLEVSDAFLRAIAP